MILSEQRKEIGDLLFTQLQEEIAGSAKENQDDFLSCVKADEMGFYGKEGIDED